MNDRTTASSSPLDARRFGLASMVVLAIATLTLSACNTTAGVGKDVSATGTAVTRSANEVKSGL